MQGIFLDRDGVINRERADYVKRWDEFEFLPNALQALRRLSTVAAPIIVITNQSVIGRKIVDRAQIDEIHSRAIDAIRTAGGRIDAIWLCPHHPDAHCSCRKPQPGMLQQAADHFDLDLAACVFVGDAITDYQAARAAGCHSILVRSGRQGTQINEYVAKYLAEDVAGEFPADLPKHATATLTMPQTEHVSTEHVSTEHVGTHFAEFSGNLKPVSGNSAPNSESNHQNRTTQTRQLPQTSPSFHPPIVSDLAAAVELILKSGYHQ